MSPEPPSDGEPDSAKSAKPAKKTKAKKAKPKESDDSTKLLDDIDIPIVTQDSIDEKFERIQASRMEGALMEEDINDAVSDESVKLLDVALEKGTIDSGDVEREKKKVKFFKDNFPSR